MCVSEGLSIKRLQVTSICLMLNKGSKEKPADFGTQDKPSRAPRSLKSRAYVVLGISLTAQFWNQNATPVG